MTLPLNTAIILLIGHWIGDFVLQGNVMATHKGKSLKWLLLHVLIYTVVLTIPALYLFPLSTAVLFIAVNAGLHLITDFFTSKLSARYAEVPRIFFPILGLDQLTHAVTLLATAVWVTRQL